MIIKKSTVMAVFILFILFTSLFVSIVSIAEMPDKIMGGKDIYILTSSTDKNPLRSNLDINIAYGLENMSYVESVSPEIFVFTTIENKAVTIRGVIFSKLLSLEGGKIIEGEMPHDYGDALLGYRAQKILNLKIGDKLSIRGGFASSLAVINITGIYKSDSPTDDEIIVDLSTARKLAGIGNDEISIIRIKSKNQGMLKKFMDPKSPKFTVNLNVTSESYIGESINVSAKIKNMGMREGSCNLTLFWNGREIKYSNISVYTEKRVYLEIKAPKIPGNYTLKATVSNPLLHYTYSVNIKVKKRPIFVRGPTNIIENTYSTFYAYSIHQDNLKNLTLEIRGEDYSSLSTGNSPLRIKIPRSGNYTLIFSKEGYKEACIEVKVYKKVPLEELATIKNLYNGTIILQRGEKIEIESDGKIYFSIDNSSLVEKSGNITIPKYLKGMHKVNITVIKDNMLGWQNFNLLILENYNPEIISLHPSEKAYYGERVSFQIRDKLPIKNVSVYYENKRKDYEINQKLGMKENYTFNVTVTLNSSEEIRIFFSDILGKVYNASFKFHLIYQKDVIPPEIIVPDKIEIWGGNSTIIRAEDNVALDLLSVFIFGRYFNTSSTNISIPTIFWNGSIPYFIPPGAYMGKVFARDVNNNTNSTTFMLIVNNYNERNPPIISGPEFYNLGFNFSCEYRAWDNSFVRRMWVLEENKKIESTYGNFLAIGYQNLGEGYHNVTIYAEDIYGNVNMMNATLFCEYPPKPKVTISLSQEEITVDTQPLLSITLQNGDLRGYYNLTVYIDGRMVIWKWILLNPHEIKNLYIVLPNMPVGTHTITVADQEVEIKVVEVKEKLPVDTLLKYAKNLKVSGSRDVIYRGFEISEGNVILTFTSLILITMVLVFLGVYYSTLKGMKVSTIGILRAIGASNKDIQKFLWRDVMKYLVPSVVGGIFLGYIITLLLNHIGILQAFGHRLIISPSPLQLLQLLLLSLLFLFFSTSLIIRKISTTKPVHLLGSKKSEKIIRFEEVLK